MADRASASQSTPLPTRKRAAVESAAEDTTNAQAQPNTKRRKPAQPDANEVVPEGSDSSIDLALAHLVTDHHDHPLYWRNSQFVLENWADSKKIEASISKRFRRLKIRCRDLPVASPEKQAQARRALTYTLAKNILRTVAAEVTESIGILNSKANFDIKDSAEDYRVLFRLTPCLPLEDNGEEVPQEADRVEIKDEKDDTNGGGL